MPPVNTISYGPRFRFGITHRHCTSDARRGTVLWTTGRPGGRGHTPRASQGGGLQPAGSSPAPPPSTLGYMIFLAAATVVTQVAAAACIASSLRASINEAKFDIVYNEGKKMDAKFAEVDSKFAALGKKIDAKFALADAKMDAKCAVVDSKFAAIDGCNTGESIGQFAAIAKSMDTKSASRADAVIYTIGAILCTSAVVVYCSRK
ncbi:hypothetical protein ACK3TF_002848 [Chlorella vulgaris]